MNSDALGGCFVAGLWAFMAFFLGAIIGGIVTFFAFPIISPPSGPHYGDGTGYGVVMMFFVLMGAFVCGVIGVLFGLVGKFIRRGKKPDSN